MTQIQIAEPSVFLRLIDLRIDSLRRQPEILQCHITEAANLTRLRMHMEAQLRIGDVTRVEVAKHYLKALEQCAR